MIALWASLFLWTTVVSGVSSNDNDCLVDVIFLIDGSSSINSGQFRTTITYVDQLTSMLAIRPQAHRIALLEYSGRYRVIREYGFDNFTSVDEFRDRLLHLPQMRGTTFTARALERVLVVLNGRRPEARSVVVTVTDGFSFDNPAPVVAKIAALGTNLFSFNVNEPYNQNELLILANGVKENVFHLPHAIEDAQTRLGPFLRCESSTAVVGPVAGSNCSISPAPSSSNANNSLKQALTDLRDREKINGSEALILFTKGFSCDYPGQYANSLRDQGTAVYVVGLSNGTDMTVAAGSNMTVSSINSQMLMKSDIHALLALLRLQYCKLQEQLKTTTIDQERLKTTTIGYGS